MFGFLLVVVAMLLLLGFRLEVVSRLQGGSRELVGTGQLFSLFCIMGISQVCFSTWSGL